MVQNKENMLYLMHIDWNWIKQRPQFIAEGLSHKYNVTVMHRYRYSSSSLVKNKSNLKIVAVHLLPSKLSKIQLTRFINFLIFKRKVNKYITEHNPEYIYIAYPNFIKYIPKEYHGKIIYDCMDDHIAMDSSSHQKEILANETEAVRRCSVLLVSSDDLRRKLTKRYKIENDKIYIIRNGFNGPILSEKFIKEEKSKKEFTYFGTISSWFNFDYIVRSLNDFPDITYKLIGPVSIGITLPKNNRIKFVGPVNHENLYEEIKNSAALIMPFKLNDIVKSVDPVKLYEYINFDKDILTVKYDEIKRFSNFVYFYNNYSEYKEAIKKIKMEKKIRYSKSMRESFLNNNSWQNRVDKIQRILATI